MTKEKIINYKGKKILFKPFKEETLSDKRKELEEFIRRIGEKNDIDIMDIEDIIRKIKGQDKEFIKKLKEKLHCVKKDNIDSELTEGEKFANMSMNDAENVIDKLAGKDLI